MRMFQVISMWNLSNPDEEMAESLEKVEYRGYTPEKTYLTSQFANKISKGIINPLAVGNIADQNCPARRDLYYEKGSNREYRRRGSKMWGRTAGPVSQRYLASLFSEYLKKRNSRDYAKVAKRIDTFSSFFRRDNEKEIQKLHKLARKEYEDPNRLLKTLAVNGRIEMAAKMLHTTLSKNKHYMNLDDLSLEYEGKKIEFHPNPIEIGINKPSTPDFFIEKFKAVGDIKTGVYFDVRYLLTCTGYALAFENWKKMDINWGLIYFIPSRIPIEYAKPITYAQLYIFPIDDVLRGWFLEERIKAYEIVSENAPPDFPEDKDKCEKSKCKYTKACKEMGWNI